MKDFFSCSWMMCINESMSIWCYKCTCPEWIFVTHKPLTFGNDYQKNKFFLSGNVFAMLLVNDNNEPPEQMYINSETNKYGNTCGLLLCLCLSLYFTGKVVILYSVFYVLRAIVELKKLGVFTHAFIKNRVIDQHM